MKIVLSVGQCAADHAGINRLITELGAKAIKVDLHSDVASLALQHKPVLILINRINDSDGTAGIDFIAELKTDPRIGQIPIMLVSNYEDAQLEAKSNGAVQGFGKSMLSASATRDLLRNYL